MPCRSDYLEQTPAEFYRQNTAKRLKYVQQKCCRQADADVEVAAVDIYCNEDFTDRLCSLLRKIKTEDIKMFDSIVYNSREKSSRALADWWEEHEEMDRKRRDTESAEYQQKRLAKAVRAKLSPAELEAVLKYSTDDE